MDGRTGWVPDGVDVDLPGSARVHDHLPGGGHDFAADRTTAERLARVLPMRDMPRAVADLHAAVGRKP